MHQGSRDFGANHRQGSFPARDKSGLDGETEADARYRLAILYFMSHAFAQAKYHLEAALQMPEQIITAELRRHIYQQMSRTCHYLGQADEEQKYSKLQGSGEPDFAVVADDCCKQASLTMSSPVKHLFGWGRSVVRADSPGSTKM